MLLRRIKKIIALFARHQSRNFNHFADNGKEMERAMYKKQMILQRIVCYLVLGAAALVFIYSLGLVTDLYDNNFNFYAQNLKRPKVAGTVVYYYIQDFNRALTGSGLVLILLALAQFITQNHARRKYYIANYITVGANAVAALGISAWALANIFTYRAQYVSIDFDALAAEAAKYSFTWYYSTFWFDIAIAVFAILLIANIVNVTNLFFKRSLMKAEQQLIKEGREA